MTSSTTEHEIPDPKPEKGRRRIDVGTIRREQIIEAAISIIVGQGLQNLSLSKIEERTGMKRGQLTYYFPAKEDILLAVFDRLLHRMIERMHDDQKMTEKHGIPPMWDMTRRMLGKVLHHDTRENPLWALENTFLAQVEYREDYRNKLASQYEEWRGAMAAHWNVSAKPAVKFASHNPRVVASFMQAIVKGLNVLLIADPNAFDREEMLSLCIDIVRPLFTNESTDD